MPLEPIQGRKECGDYRGQNVFVIFFYLLTASPSVEDKRGHS